ncbi:hypothetical protein ACLB90_15670 [Stenotrophomonas sp. LGBM10]
MLSTHHRVRAALAAAKLLPGQHVIFECQSVRAGDLSLGIIHLAGCKRR